MRLERVPRVKMSCNQSRILPRNVTKLIVIQGYDERCTTIVFVRIFAPERKALTWLETFRRAPVVAHSGDAELERFDEIIIFRSKLR